MPTTPDPTPSTDAKRRSVPSASTDSSRIIIAPDSFKDVWPAQEAAAIIADGWRKVRPMDDLEICPVADGGEGTLDALLTSLGGREMSAEVTGPLGGRRQARWGWIESTRTAIIEIAEASGLHLVPVDHRDPTKTTTFGTGELIRAAIERGAQEIIIGIGGSATCDGGAGMAQALGVRFSRADDSVIDQPMTGGRLDDIARVEGSTISLPPMRVMCDVTNQLCGERGAARVFGPQKGATPAQVEELDAALARLVQLLGERARAVALEPGAGAAGGLGFGLRYWCGATLERGVELVLDTIDFNGRLRAADLVITGEGRLDASSFDGKAMTGVTARAERMNVPCIAVVGSIAPDVPPEAMARAFAHVEAAGDADANEESRRRALITAAQWAARWWSESSGKPPR